MARDPSRAILVGARFLAAVPARFTKREVFVIRRLTTTLFCLILVLPRGAVAQGDAASSQRDAQMQAWSQQDLSTSLRAELEALYSERQTHNSRVASFRQHFQQLVGDYNSSCVGQRLDASAQARCRSKRQTLEQEQANGAEFPQLAAALISRYDDLARQIESHLAANRGADQASWETAWQRARTDALSCSPSNGHGYCSGAGGDYASCQDGYARGFQDGAGARDLRLQRAYDIGHTHGAAGEENVAFNHPDASGSCRIQWVQEYNRGHFDGGQANP